MIYRITKAKPIKETVVRLYIDELEIDSHGSLNIAGEYEIAVDAYYLIGTEHDTKSLIDLLKIEIAKLKHLNERCNQIEGLDWKEDE